MNRCIVWDKVDNQSPQNTPQVLPSFEVYTPPVTYPKEIEETIGISMKVEPLNQPKLEDVGLTDHEISLSSRGVPSFDEPKPQTNPLPNCPSLDISLGDERGPKPPIKPRSSDSFRMKVIDPFTIYTPPSPHVSSFHLKDVYCYYHSCIDDLKKHYGSKPGLLGHSGSLGVDFSKLEMIEDDWELEFKEVSFLRRGLNLPDRTKEVEKVRIRDSHHLEHIFQHIFPTYGSSSPQWCVSLLSPALDLKCRGTLPFICKIKIESGSLLEQKEALLRRQPKHVSFTQFF
nr:ribonuclease H-like domain-containing protein [Tanacetum cinerariifolium]